MNNVNTVNQHRGATEYQERINKVTRYIQAHLGEPLQLEILAEIAGFSPFHFHRIFAAYTGETMAEYIRRLHLERAVKQLFDSSKPITVIALDAGYETPSAFTKAFKQHFGITPSELREMNRQSAVSIIRQIKSKEKQRRLAMKAEVRVLPDRKVLYVRRTGMIDNNFNHAAKEAFTALWQFLGAKNLDKDWTHCLSITPDDPSIIPPENCRYDAGVILRDGVKVEPKGEVQFQTLEGGRWAVFLHKGPYEMMWQTWNAAYRDWLPASGASRSDSPPYEVYLDSPSQTAPEDLRTELYIPLK